MNDLKSKLESTPALVIDLPTVERNIDRLAAYAASHKIGIRPHTKTHKSVRIAARQVQAGAIGLTAAKVGEAEVMADVSPDVLVAYPIVDAFRASHLASLAKQATVRTTADSAAGIESLAAAAAKAGTTIGVLVDLDIGFHRTGAQTPAATLELARLVASKPSLRLDGLFFYPGHVWLPIDEQPAELKRIDGLLLEAIDLWRRDGLKASIVSGGSTPTAYQSHHVTALTEIRPGTYPYNDMNTARAGFCEIDDCAARMICTVISAAVPGKVVIDGGTKTFTSDRNVKFPDSGHGHVVEFPQAKITRFSEEHGEIDLQGGPAPKIGDRVTVIPNHICPCVNLHDSAWLAEAGGTLTRMTTSTRGMIV